MLFEEAMYLVYARTEVIDLLCLKIDIEIAGMNYGNMCRVKCTCMFACRD